jgi:hypothetical protein
MSNKKQTSVEWLFEEFFKVKWDSMQGNKPLIFEQAKQLHKQEIIDAITIGFDEGRSYIHNGTTKFETGLQYYKETYEQ